MANVGGAMGNHLCKQPKSTKRVHLYAQQAGISIVKSWCCVPLYHSLPKPKPNARCNTKHGNRVMRT